MDVILSLLSGANRGVGGVSPAGTSTSSQLPAPFNTLNPGALIRGFVLNRDASGNPVLRTNLGDFLVQSDFFLKIGSEVVVRVDANGGAARTSILSVDGLSPQAAESIPAHSADADVIQRSDQPTAQNTQTARANALEGVPVPRREIVLNGTLLQPAILPNSPEFANLQLSRGAQLVLKLLNITLPQVEVLENSTTTPQTTGENPKPAPQMQPLSAYQRYAEKQMPLSPTTQAQTFTPSSIAAEVLSEADAAEPLISTPLGLVRLASGTPYPQGTKMTLELVLNALSTAPAPNTTAIISSLASGTGSLQEVIDTLLQTMGDDSIGMLRQLLPASSFSSVPTWQNLGPTAQNLSAGLSFFMSALTGGNFRDLIGSKATRTLELAGKTELLAKAEAEFSVQKNLYLQPPAGQWQALFVPMLAEGEIKPIRYYSKREKKQTAQGDAAETHTRFVVELELSETGPVQLDGFVRKREGAATQFDLILRSAHAFTATELREMQEMFALIGDATGYKGQLQIHTTADFPVTPLEDILQAQRSEVVV